MEIAAKMRKRRKIEGYTASSEKELLAMAVLAVLTGLRM